MEDIVCNAVSLVVCFVFTWYFLVCAALLTHLSPTSFDQVFLVFLPQTFLTFLSFMFLLASATPFILTLDCTRILMHRVVDRDVDVVVNVGSSLGTLG